MICCTYNCNNIILFIKIHLYFLQIKSELNERNSEEQSVMLDISRLIYFVNDVSPYMYKQQIVVFCKKIMQKYNFF